MKRVHRVYWRQMSRGLKLVYKEPSYSSDAYSRTFEHTVAFIGLDWSPTELRDLDSCTAKVPVQGLYLDLTLFESERIGRHFDTVEAAKTFVDDWVVRELPSRIRLHDGETLSLELSTVRGLPGRRKKA